MALNKFHYFQLIREDLAERGIRAEETLKNSAFTDHPAELKELFTELIPEADPTSDLSRLPGLVTYCNSQSYTILCKSFKEFKQYIKRGLQCRTSNFGLYQACNNLLLSMRVMDLKEDQSKRLKEYLRSHETATDIKEPFENFSCFTLRDLHGYIDTERFSANCQFILIVLAESLYKEQQ